MTRCPNLNGSAAGGNNKFIKSVSAGGESVTLDTNAAKAADRYEQSQKLVNIYNGCVRKTFGAIIGARPS